MTTKAQRQRATAEMIATINRRAESARLFRKEESMRRAALEKKEAQEKRDEEITKMALWFSFGLLIGTACITVALWLLGIHPMQAVVP
nr:MAG TPA: hypothetical protein [Caudoviricetes sp.]